MSVTYSTIKSISEPDAIADVLREQVLGPVLPSVRVKSVKRKPGRRFEAPRVMWNVYEAELELPGGIEAHPLFWTKAFFEDTDCQEYRRRVGRLLVEGGNPLDPNGSVRFIESLNLFLFFFPRDPIFPRLSVASSGVGVRPLLEPQVAALRPQASLRSIDVVRVKYLPEISCLFRYDVDIGDAEPLQIYGKVQHSQRGATTYQVMKALWDLPARRSGDLVLSQPLAYYPHEAVLLQSAVAGQEVKGDRHSEIFLGQAEAAGRMIGHIHQSGIQVGGAHDVRVEINRLESRLEEFKMSAPRVYLLLRQLLRQIAATAERIPAEAAVPSHGDYKYNQFLFDGTQYGLIDVEYFVQAEPSFDLGKYCGHLWPAAPKDWSDTAQAKQARRLFLDAYVKVRPNFRSRRLGIYEALSLATRALVVTWSQQRNFQYMAETLTALGFEQLKARWGE